MYLTETFAKLVTDTRYEALPVEAVRKATSLGLIEGVGVEGLDGRVFGKVGHRHPIYRPYGGSRHRRRGTIEHGEHVG
mgnify:CR=1 FL=1